MNIFFIVFLFILAFSGLAYGIYQRNNAVLHAQVKAHEKFSQKIQMLEASELQARGYVQKLEREVAMLRYDRQIANERIKQLESMVRIPLKRMPTGSLVKGYNKKVEVGKADPTPTDVLQNVPMSHMHLYNPEQDGDLPPIQVL